MAGIVYGIPYVPPAPPESPWVSMPMKWTGWDGSAWNMHDGAEGVLLMAGVRGFGEPPHAHWRSQSPAVAGSRWRGAVSDAREVFWPLKLWHDVSSREWVARDRAFWRTLNPQKTGVWEVTHPDGARRRLTLRIQSDGDPSFDTIPSRRGWARYGVTLTADQPFWEGEPITRQWSTATASDFFNGASKAPVFNISSASTLATAKLSNPGDVDAYVKWTAVGPFTSVTVGVGSATVVAPIAATAGQRLVIDTDPAIQAAFLDGVDVTAQLTSAQFAPLPSGEDVALSLSMAGTGSVEASFTPRFLRAW